jgi:putative FmdB family regulatory protein
MPLYTYFCKKCNKENEKIVSIEKRDNVYCGVCEMNMQRLLDTPGMVWSPTRNNGHSF